MRDAECIYHSIFGIPRSTFRKKMNYLDIIIAIILFLFGWQGLRKGLIREVVALLAFGVGIYGAMHFSDFTAAHLQDFMDIKPQYLNTVAFVLTFIVLVVLVNLIGHLITKAVRSLNLGFFDKLGGFLFRALKGVLLCSTIVLVLNNLLWIGVVKEEVRQQSFLYPYVEKTVPYLYKGFDLVKGYAHEMLPEQEENEASSESTSVAF